MTSLTSPTVCSEGPRPSLFARLPSSGWILQFSPGQPASSECQGQKLSFWSKRVRAHFSFLPRTIRSDISFFGEALLGHPFSSFMVHTRRFRLLHNNTFSIKVLSYKRRLGSSVSDTMCGHISCLSTSMTMGVRHLATNLNTNDRLHQTLISSRLLVPLEVHRSAHLLLFFV